MNASHEIRSRARHVATPQPLCTPRPEHGSLEITHCALNTRGTIQAQQRREWGRKHVRHTSSSAIIVCVASSTLLTQLEGAVSFLTKTDFRPSPMKFTLTSTLWTHPAAFTTLCCGTTAELHSAWIGTAAAHHMHARARRKVSTREVQGQLHCVPPLRSAAPAPNTPTAVLVERNRVLLPRPPITVLHKLRNFTCSFPF